MNKIAKFYKVSTERFVSDWMQTFNVSKEEALNVYNAIILPKRATKGSAGYDFFTPVSFALEPNEEIKIPTGIRVKIKEDWVLCLFPRSSWGFKFRLQVNNTVGIIDSDYYYSDNEGHIFIKLTNDTKENKIFTINQNDAVVQGIFLQYGIVEDDNTKELRNGGLGSTTKG